MFGAAHRSPPPARLGVHSAEGFTAGHGSVMEGVFCNVSGREGAEPLVFKQGVLQESAFSPAEPCGVASFFQGRGRLWTRAVHFPTDGVFF